MQREALLARDFASVALAKAAVSTLVLISGFRAVSDDDYARVVIAQRFVAEPSLDPTGTSWLPFPFWLQGTLMAIFGRSIDVARATSFGLGVASALLVLVAAHWIGVPRRAAVIGAIVAAVFPYSAWLGVATVPDLPTAALIVLGCAAAGSSELGRRALGALALGAASLSRYEAWPVAAGFALLAIADAVRSRRPALGAIGALAALGPSAWLLHGALGHGDAFFFVSRVSAYKRALGATGSTLSALVGQPLAIFRCEPELGSLVALALAIAIAKRCTPILRRHLRPLALLGVLVVFLVAGELRASGATHHAERAVLAVWLWLSLLGADLAWSSWPSLGRRARIVGAAAGAGLLLLGALVLRPWYARRDSFIDRAAEVAIGRTARERAKPDDRLLIDSSDFGFYAVIAGFTRPEKAEPVDDRDPRRPPAPDAFASEASLRERVAGARARWLVVQSEHASLASRLGSIEHHDSRYLLVALPQSP